MQWRHLSSSGFHMADTILILIVFQPWEYINTNRWIPFNNFWKHVEGTDPLLIYQIHALLTTSNAIGVLFFNSAALLSCPEIINLIPLVAHEIPQTLPTPNLGSRKCQKLTTVVAVEIAVTFLFEDVIPVTISAIILVIVLVVINHGRSYK